MPGLWVQAKQRVTVLSAKLERHTRTRAYKCTSFTEELLQL